MKRSSIPSKPAITPPAPKKKLLIALSPERVEQLEGLKKYYSASNSSAIAIAIRELADRIDPPTTIINVSKGAST